VTEVLHANCVCCLSERARLSPTEATLVILHMLADDCTAESIERDLCFAHRRQLDIARRHREATP
jgi:hypothetical protein